MSKSKINWGKTGLFAAGVAFGTAGIKLLSSKDAKKLYTNCTAAVLRAKDCFFVCFWFVFGFVFFFFFFFMRV